MDILDFCDNLRVDFEYGFINNLNISNCSQEQFFTIKRHCVTWESFQKLVPFFFCTPLKYGFQLKALFSAISINNPLIDTWIEYASRFQNVRYFYNSKLDKSDTRAHFIACKNECYVMRDNKVKLYKSNLIHFRIGLCLECISAINKFNEINNKIIVCKKRKLKTLMESKIKIGSIIQPIRSIRDFHMSSISNFTVVSTDFANLKFKAQYTNYNTLTFRINNFGHNIWTTDTETYGSGRRITYSIDFDSKLFRDQKFSFIKGLYRPCLIQKILARGDVINIFKIIFSFLDRIQK